jgi:hypothetical protein
MPEPICALRLIDEGAQVFPADAFSDAGQQLHAIDLFRASRRAAAAAHGELALRFGELTLQIALFLAQRGDTRFGRSFSGTFRLSAMSAPIWAPAFQPSRAPRRPWPPRSGAHRRRRRFLGALALHGSIERLGIDRDRTRAQRILRQVQRESVGVVELERHVAIKDVALA